MSLGLINNPATYAVECPYCHRQTPALELSNYLDISGKYVIAKCLLCNSIFFIKQDIEDPNKSIDDANECTFHVYPPTVEQASFPKEINSVSSMFQDLYNEALKSEKFGLTNVCGLAYRRAFEFLLRDFACYLCPDKKDEIINDSNFSNVISNRIPNTDTFREIKEISKRVWWIGSDYAHYAQKYEETDISDLKNMIDILVLNIEIFIKSEKYKEITKR